MTKGGKNGVELAKAYVQIIPSMEGVQANIEEALNGGSGGMGDIGSRAGEQLGKGLTSAFTKAIGFLKDSVETGMGFDSAMSQVAATMGVAVDEITVMRDKAKEMGAATNYSATQAAEGLNILAMSGYDAEHSMDMLEDVLHLAAAGGMEMSEAAGDISGAMKGFGDASKDATYYADLMAKGATLANTSVSQLGNALSDSASMGKAYSQSAEDMTVSLLRLAEQGEVGSNAATMLSAAMANVYTPMEQGKKVMDELGVSAYDTAGKTREFNTVINELNTAIERESQGNEAIANQYKDLIFGKQGLNAYNKLVVTSIDTQEQWTQALKESTGAAAQQYDTMTDNLKGDLDMMKSAFEGLQIAVSDELSGDVRKLVQTATEGLTWLTEHTNTLIGVIKGIGIAFAAMKLPAMIGAVTTAMRTLNAVCAQFPLAAAFAAAVAVGEVLKGVIDDATDKINEIPDAFEGLDAGEVDFVKSIADGTDDLAEAEHRLGEAEVRLKNLQTERDATLKNRAAAEKELMELREKETWTNEEWAKAEQLEYEIIPQLTEKLHEQNAAVGEMAAAKLSAKAQVDALSEAQAELAEETAEVTEAEQIQTETEEELAAKKEV
ncbi:MAG: phage tail tape measure protein, partial [Clostridia bacterium]|nr:phage tail tape measure protein [Clostridia bacterium]